MKLNDRQPAGPHREADAEGRAEHQEDGVADRDPAQQRRHGRAAEGRQRVGHIGRLGLPLDHRFGGGGAGAGRRRGLGLGSAEQRMLVGPVLVALLALLRFDGRGEQRVGPIGGQVVAGDQIGEGAVDRLAIIFTGS